MEGAQQGDAGPQSSLAPSTGSGPYNRAVTSPASRRFHIRTYGCQMNEHDSERLAGLLVSEGLEPTDSLDEADVVVLALPLSRYRTIPADELAGKVVIDAMNHWWEVDGPRDELLPPDRSSSEHVQEALPGTRVVRAFNCIPAESLAKLGNRKPERLAIPLGGDDPAALDVAQRLVRDAGFDPVVLGSLAQSRQFDLGGPLAKGDLTAAELKKLAAR